MELLTLLLKLPFLPVQGVIKLGELIQEEAERQLYDPARIRRELEEAQRRRDAGEISDDELAQIQDELTSTLVTGAAPPAVTREGDDRSDRHG
ncbi:MAG TPA: gas vesicle protein GvpG [Trebonia sp.]|nr:gas vesicle protein GvpG [Trebonia sp.]